MSGMWKKKAALQAMGRAALSAVLWCCAPVVPVHAADPVKVGLSLALTGGVAANGKQLLAALEIWRDDINAKGGLAMIGLLVTRRAVARRNPPLAANGGLRFANPPYYDPKIDQQRQAP